LLQKYRSNLFLFCAVVQAIVAVSVAARQHQQQQQQQQPSYIRSPSSESADVITRTRRDVNFRKPNWHVLAATNNVASSVGIRDPLWRLCLTVCLHGCSVWPDYDLIYCAGRCLHHSGVVADFQPDEYCFEPLEKTGFSGQ
jgi:hypothetical protein